jgi:predicted tellurium resistance membrane protein TerC
MNPAKEFLVVLAFCLGFLLSTIGETDWLNRRTSAGIYRSLFITFTSNIFSVTLGYFFSYLVFLVAYFVFAGLMNKIPVLSEFLWFVFLLAIASAPLMIAKRVLLRITKIDPLSRPWTYAAVAALVFQVSVLVVPLLVGLYA